MQSQLLKGCFYFINFIILLFTTWLSLSLSHSLFFRSQSSSRATDWAKRTTPSGSDLLNWKTTASTHAYWGNLTARPLFCSTGPVVALLLAAVNRCERATWIQIPSLNGSTVHSSSHITPTSYWKSRAKVLAACKTKYCIGPYTRHAANQEHWNRLLTLSTQSLPGGPFIFHCQKATALSVLEWEIDSSQGSFDENALIRQYHLKRRASC